MRQGKHAGYASMFAGLDPRQTELHSLLSESGLPGELQCLVHSVIAGARLWQSERIAVARELIAHFQDGLDAGCPKEHLMRSFGAPGDSAELIGKAKRRGRSAAAILAHYGPWAVAAALLPLCLIYAVASMKLYSLPSANSWRSELGSVQSAQVPVRSDARRRYEALLADPQKSSGQGGLDRIRRAADAGAISIPFALSGDISSREAAHRSAWGRDSAFAREVVALADETLATAADNREMVDRFDIALAMAAQLRNGDTLQHELAGLTILDRTLAVLDRWQAPRKSWSRAPGSAPLVAALRKLHSSGPVLLQPEIVALAWHDLQPRLFAQGDGRLTGEGLRLLQALRGKYDPGAAALLLEPYHFADSADRAEIELSGRSMIDAIKADGAGAPPWRLRAMIRSSPLRLAPLAMLAPELAEGLDAASRANQRLERLTP